MVAAVVFAATLFGWWSLRVRLNATETPAPWLVGVVAVAALLAAVLWFRPRRALAALGLRHAIVFPPYWFGIAFGIAAAYLFVAHFRDAQIALDLDPSAAQDLVAFGAILGFAPLGVAAVSAFAQLFPPRRAKRRYGGAHGNLDSWLETDQPVSNAEDDLFEYVPIARRIADRLRQDSPPAQAVLGKLGSGKTTLRNLVAAQLELSPKHGNIEVIGIDLWPYETPEAAVQGILRVLIAAMEREVSTSRLADLPASYVDAISKAAGLHPLLPDRGATKESPSEVLRYLDTIATVIRRRYVLWVEDLERFALGNPGAEHTDPAEMERLAPIRALLFGLDNLRSVTVVMATTTLFQRFDLEKIARYVERLPEISQYDAKRLVGRFRSQWYASAKIIDPAEDKRHALGWERELPESEREFRWIVDGIASLADAVAALATTPRILKQGLRRAAETWERLKGEIDLDDVIALCILRESAPQAFALVESVADRLRRKVISVRRDYEPLHDFSARLEKLPLPELARAATLTIVKTLFDKNSGRPQGVWASYHADYWNRFLVVPAIGADSSDQRVLRVLEKEDDDAVLELLDDANTSDAVEDFDRMLEVNRVQRLFKKHVAKHLNDDPGQWPEGRPPGFIPLWRMIRDRMGALDIELLAQDITEAMTMCAPKNLALLQEIDHFYVTHSRDLPDLLPKSDRARLRNHVETLLQGYLGRPNELADAAKNARPFTLVWLAWGLEKIRADRDRGEPFAGWRAFASTLLDAVEKRPEVMLALVVPFVVRQEFFARDGREHWNFDRARCAELFEDPNEFAARIMRLSSRTTPDARIEAVTTGATVPVAAGEEIVVDEAREIAADVGAVPTQRPLRNLIEGYWFRDREDIQSSRPDYSPTGAIYSRDGKVAPEFLCLDMIADEDTWRPLSEAALHSHAHSAALGAEQPYYFVLSEEWPRTFVAKLEGSLDKSEVVSQFGPEVGTLVPEDLPTAVLRLHEV